jgi:hypothetical protein
VVVDDNVDGAGDALEATEVEVEQVGGGHGGDPPHAAVSRRSSFMSVHLRCSEQCGPSAEAVPGVLPGHGVAWPRDGGWAAQPARVIPDSRGGPLVSWPDACHRAALAS